MIAFVTLLLGLVHGVFPVEVKVSAPVVAVDFSLDGMPAGRLEGPPWVARIDLGTDLRPHELVARGLDGDGKEITRVSQWLNLPRPHAEVDIVLERGADGVTETAVLTWQSVHSVKATSIHLSLDGQPLKVDERGRAKIPSRDPKSLHILTAEVRFASGLAARKDVAFGGEYGSEVATELTALPVRLRAGATLPPPAGLQGWFAAGGRALPVAAVEDGPGRVVVVRVPSGAEFVRRLVSYRPLGDVRQQTQLGEDDLVRFVSLSPKIYANSRVPSEIFDTTEDFTWKDGGLYSLLGKSLIVDSQRQEEPRIADAVAVAGLQAARENHRRAVVLVLGREVPDASGYDPVTVRAYLDFIRVPLFVWSLHRPDTPMAQAWGGAEDISTPAKLEEAVARLRTELASQRIVWVEGRHLPQVVSRTPAAGVELVGTR